MLVLVFLLKCGHQQMDASTDIGEKEITFFFFFFLFQKESHQSQGTVLPVIYI